MDFDSNTPGLAYGKKKKYDKAIKDFTEAIRLKPDHAGAYHSRGIAYQKIGQKESRRRLRQVQGTRSQAVASTTAAAASAVVRAMPTFAAAWSAARGFRPWVKFDPMSLFPVFWPILRRAGGNLCATGCVVPGRMVPEILGTPHFLLLSVLSVRYSAFGSDFTILRIASFVSSESDGQSSITRIKSGSNPGFAAPTAPDSAPPVSESGVFPAGFKDRSSPSGGSSKRQAVPQLAVTCRRKRST